MHPAHILQLARGAIRLCGVKQQRPFESNDLFDGLGQFPDGDIFSSAQINKAGLGIAEQLPGDDFIGLLHQEQATSSHVVNVEQLSPGGAATPDNYFLCIIDFGFMEAANQGRQDVAVLGMEIITRAVEVGGHDGDEFRAVLPIVGFTHLDAGDFGDGIRFVCWFQVPSQKMFFPHWLGGQFGVDAGGTQKEQSFDAMQIGLVDDVVLDLQVEVDEFSGVAVVGMDATHLGGSQDDVFRLFLVKEGSHGLLVGQIQLIDFRQQQVGIATGFQLPDDGGADQPLGAGNEDFVVAIHGSRRSGSHAF